MFEQGSVSSLIAEKCKPYMVCMEKHVLSKNVYKWAKHGFATRLNRKYYPWSRSTLTL